MRADPRTDALGRHGCSLLVLAAGAVAALGSSRTTPEPRERLPGETESSARRQQPHRRAAALPYPACPGPGGVLTRRSLEIILRRGPGLFLSGLDVTMVPASALPEAVRRAWPALSGAHEVRAFGGWRLERFHPGDPCLGRADLRPGDVVISVNGNRLRRPEDLGSLWQGLVRAPHLVARIVRDGEPLTFVVRIADPSPAERPTPARPTDP